MSKRDTRRKRAKWRNRPAQRLTFWVDEASKIKPRHIRYLLKQRLADNPALALAISNPGER